MTARDSYVLKKKTQLDEWSAEMDKLEERILKTKDRANDAFQTQLKALRAKRQEGEDRIEKIKGAAETSWEQLKTETELIWTALTDSVQQFKSHFKP